MAAAKEEQQTSIVPHSVTAAALEEAARWLGTPLPRHWVHQLAERANTVCLLALAPALALASIPGK